MRQIKAHRLLIKVLISSLLLLAVCLSSVYADVEAKTIIVTTNNNQYYWATSAIALLSLTVSLINFSRTNSYNISKDLKTDFGNEVEASVQKPVANSLKQLSICTDTITEYIYSNDKTPEKLIQVSILIGNYCSISIANIKEADFYLSEYGIKSKFQDLLRYGSESTDDDELLLDNFLIVEVNSPNPDLNLIETRIAKRRSIINKHLTIKKQEFIKQEINKNKEKPLHKIFTTKLYKISALFYAFTNKNKLYLFILLLYLHYIFFIISPQI